MCDKLVFDLSQEVEGSPNVFIRKDWINILDNQNQNYQNNQSIIDTSQLSNSNKYMGYREAYLSVPLTLSLATPAVAVANGAGSKIAPTVTVGANPALNPTRNQGNADCAIGLKNWYGSIIHSFTLDYNGTTIIQQTPFCNMWNSFKLLTTLSYSDVKTMGSTIGFYPDTSNSWNFNLVFNAAGADFGNEYNGIFYSNNDVSSLTGNNITNDLSAIGARINIFTNDGLSIGGNAGLGQRVSYINYNPNINSVFTSSTFGAVGAPYNVGAASFPTGVTAASCNQIWKSYIYKQVTSTAQLNGQMQIAVMATIYLKHVHSFFNMIPLLKGVFMKMTMNLNNASTTVTIAQNADAIGGAANSYSNYTASVPVGGVNPLLIPSYLTGSYNVYGGNSQAFNNFLPPDPQAGNYWYNLSVGARVTDNNVICDIGGANGWTGTFTENPLSKSIYLYVPAYTFNPVFEEAYLSNPVKQIKYTDIYQYQVQNITTGVQFNNLITNGIANIKSVLIIPFISQQNTYGTIAARMPSPEYQSPFDTAGTGTTAPLVTLGNFNVQISGQNAIYNTQRYTFEQFNNQLYGQFAVNGGLTDGLTSGLIGFYDFQQSYCYYYVNVERMLPVEQSVPKSVQILGTNYSTQTLDLWVFIEYGVEINIDLTTGARV